MQARFVMRCHLHTCGWCIKLRLMLILSYPSTCADEWRPTASTLCLLSLPCKELQCSNKAQKAHLQRISWLLVAFFECNTCRVMALGWLKKERMKKMNNSDFRPFQVSHLRTSFRYYHCYCRQGQPI